MRRISVILTTMILAALLLVACGGEETNTASPNTTSSPEVPPVTAESTATGDGTTATQTVSPTDGTTTAEIPLTGENDPARLTNQLDFTVWNQNGEQIGEVDDMILDLDNIRIAYVIVGTGGFLDIGERDVFVPWDSLQLQTGANDTAGGEQNVFILQADQELFNNVPELDLGSLPEAGQPAGDWDAEIRNYWESGVIPATPDPNLTATTDPGAGQATATADPGTGGQGQATATAGTGSEGQQGQAEALQGVVLASDVLGTAIGLSPGQGDGQGQGQATATAGTDTSGQATATPGTDAGQATATDDPNQGSGQGVGNFTGTIDDVIVDVDTGELQYVVVNTTLDDGERWIAIPVGFFQWDATNSMIVLNSNPAQLRDAPFFSDVEFPNTAEDGWNTDIDTYWGTF